MRKKLIIMVLLACLQVLSFAQVPGGHVIPPVKKEQSTSSSKQNGRKSNQKPAKRNSSTNSRPTMSRVERDRILDNLINNMVYVEGGTFTMGATAEQGSEAEGYEKPAHEVTVSSFSIGKYEVTQKEWQAVMGTNSCIFRGAKRPVDLVSWIDCQEFIRKLNALTGKKFRLPTEAEWEYAARGGNKSRGYKYAGSDNIDDVAWYEGNSPYNTHDVGLKKPNELGLYDMSGNVQEWCLDGSHAYDSTPQIDPIASNSDNICVIRDGSFRDPAGCCRVAYRAHGSIGYNTCDIGLRLVLPVLP